MNVNLNEPGASKWALLVANFFQVTIRLERDTFSPSQKGHQQNCQVHVFDWPVNVLGEAKSRGCESKNPVSSKWPFDHVTKGHLTWTGHLYAPPPRKKKVTDKNLVSDICNFVSTNIKTFKTVMATK